MQYKSTTIPDKSVTSAKISPVTGGSGVVMSKGTSSGALTTAASVYGSFAHGLSVIPNYISLRLTCLTAEAGYAVGDVIDCVSPSMHSSEYGINAQANATDVVYRIDATNVYNIDKTGTGATALTLANWSYEFTPFYIG